MCYVVGVKIPKKQTIKIGDKKLDLDPIELPAQSGFSYQQWPVLFNEQQGQEYQLRPGMMHWELIPNWVRNQKELTESRKKYTTLNIKWHRHWCIPIDAWCWLPIFLNGKKSTKKNFHIVFN